MKLHLQIIPETDKFKFSLDRQRNFIYSFTSLDYDDYFIYSFSKHEPITYSSKTNSKRLMKYEN